MDENKKLVLEKNLDRFDYYIEKADNKASFILALSGILLAGILFQNEVLISKNASQGFKIAVIQLVVISLIALIISDVFALLVIIPRTPKMPVKSTMYFECIKNMEKADYEYLINELDDIKTTQELINESIELAKICSKKMNHIKSSLVSLVIAVIPIIIIIVINLIYFS